MEHRAGEGVVMRVLVVSHAAVIDVNQEPFDALARAGADVVIAAPARLRTDLRGPVALRALAGSRARLHPLRVVFGGYSRALGGQRGIHLIVYAGLGRAIAAAQPDVIFVEEEPYSLAAAQCARIAAQRGLRFVVHQNQNLARRLPGPFELIGRGVLLRAAGVTVRNRAAEEQVRARGFRGPVLSFPHAIDPARYAGAAPAIDLPRPVVGFVGRLVHEKGILDLIDAMPVSGAGSLLVVGDGPLRAEAEARAASRGVRAHFAGAVAHADVPAWYAAMDVVAIPSRATATWTEQFGRIVIEANAASVPVVATACGELPNTIAATGGGIVVGNEPLADALRTYVDDEARRRADGARGRDAVCARFSIDAVGRSLHAFLAEVAA